MGRFINGAMKVFAYLVVALCVASTLAVVELDSSLDSIDQHNEDLIEIAETRGVSGARQRVSLDLGEEEAADDWEGDMLQRGGAKKMVKGMAEKAKRAIKTKKAKKAKKAKKEEASDEEKSDEEKSGEEEKGKKAKKAKGRAKKATKPTVLSARFRANKAKEKMDKALADSKQALSNAQAEAKEKVLKGTEANELSKKLAYNAKKASKKAQTSMKQTSRQVKKLAKVSEKARQAAGRARRATEKRQRATKKKYAAKKASKRAATQFVNATKISGVKQDRYESEKRGQSSVGKVVATRKKALSAGKRQSKVALGKLNKQQARLTKDQAKWGSLKDKVRRFLNKGLKQIRQLCRSRGCWQVQRIIWRSLKSRSNQCYSKRCQDCRASPKPLVKKLQRPVVLKKQPMQL